MRLCAIAGRHPLQLAEAISQSDFYDFYSLLAANQEWGRQFGDPERDRQIRSRLHYEARYIFRDQMLQLAQIIGERLLDSEPDQDQYVDPQTAQIVADAGLELRLNHDHQLAQLDRDQLAQLSLPQRARLLLRLRDHRQQRGYGADFTGVDGVWAGLVDKYAELARTGDDLRSLVQAIDRIYGLCHHGGLLTDYMDEEPWLERALHVRQATKDAGPLLRYASSDVRELLRTAAHGVAPQPVGQLRQLQVALEKTLGPAGQCTSQGDSIALEARAQLVAVTGLPGYAQLLLRVPAGAQSQLQLELQARLRLLDPHQLEFQGACLQPSYQHSSVIQLDDYKIRRPMRAAEAVITQLMQVAHSAVRHQLPPDTTIL